MVERRSCDPRLSVRPEIHHSFGVEKLGVLLLTKFVKKGLNVGRRDLDRERVISDFINHT